MKTAMNDRRLGSIGSDAPALLVELVRVADVVIVVLCGVVGYWLRHGNWEIPAPYLVAIAIGALLTANVLHLGGLYELRRRVGTTTRIGQLLVGWAVIGLSLIALAYFTKNSNEFSRLWFAIWMVMSFACMLLARGIMHWQLEQWRHAGLLKIRVAVVGANESSAHFLRHLLSLTDEDFQLVGVYDERRTRLPESFEGQPIAGGVDDLVRRFREEPIDEIVIAVPWRASARIAELVKQLKTLPVNVRLCPEAVAYELPYRGYGSFTGVPMLDIFERPLTGWGWLVKAAEDRLLAAVGLVIVLPLMGLIAMLVKLDSAGPVFFAQKRYGFNNNEFTVLKFRTMVTDAGADGDVPQARRNDPRVTNVGAFLRRTSLDELPQLFNVLKGDMSLVGPRPHAVAHNEKFADLIDDYLSRHKVKPGITGWAQVNGLRGEVDTPAKIQQRVHYDLYYIDNWSLLLDLKILLLTLFVGFIHRNAY
jgi:Undecaprenyl-phosphate glucose phosphotransferase